MTEGTGRAGTRAQNTSCWQMSGPCRSTTQEGWGEKLVPVSVENFLKSCLFLFSRWIVCREGTTAEWKARADDTEALAEVKSGQGFSRASQSIL